MYNFERLRVYSDAALLLVEEGNEINREIVSVNKFLLGAVSSYFMEVLYQTTSPTEVSDERMEQPATKISAEFPTATLTVSNIPLFSSLIDSIYTKKTVPFIRNQTCENRLILLDMCYRFFIDGIPLIKLLKEAEPKKFCLELFLSLVSRMGLLEADNLSFLLKWFRVDVTNLLEPMIGNKHLLLEKMKTSYFRVMVLGSKGTVSIFNHEKKETTTLKFLYKAIASTFLPDLGIMAIACKDKVIRIMRMETLAIETEINLDCHLLIFSPDGKRLAAITKSTLIFYTYDGENWIFSNSMTLKEDEIFKSVDWSSNGKYLALSGVKTILLVVEIDSMKVVTRKKDFNTYVEYNPIVKFLKLSNDVIYTTSHTMNMFSLSRGTNTEQKLTVSISALDIIPNTNRAVVSTEAGETAIYELKNFTRTNNIIEYSATMILCTPYDEAILIDDDLSTVALWKWGKGKEEINLRFPRKSIPETLSSACFFFKEE